MYVINIFIAIIISLGFWKQSNKDIEIRTSNASLIKTIILFVLTIFVVYFYYTTYQVATFKNYVYIDPIKGSINKIIDFDTCEWDGHSHDPNDSIAEITLCNKFDRTDNNTKHYQPGLYAIFSLTNDSSTIDYYPNFKRDANIYYNSCDYLKSHESMWNSYSHVFGILYETNTIPSLFPVIYRDSNHLEIESEDMHVEYEVSMLKSPHIWGNIIDNVGRNLDFKNSFIVSSKDNIRFWKDYITTAKCVTDEYTNNLNFFSTADLSQIIYEVVIISDIKYTELNIQFDIPIEVPSLDIKTNNVTSYGFKLESTSRSETGLFIDHARGMRRVPVHIYQNHVKFPTYANFQIIRSLILTTILTALISMFFLNLFYYMRKVFKNHTKKHSLSYIRRKQIVSIWIPAGKIFVTYIIFIILCILICSMIKYVFIIESHLKWWSIILFCLSNLLIVSSIIFLYLYFHPKFNKIYNSQSVKYTIKRYVRLSMLYIYRLYRKKRKPLSQALSWKEEPKEEEPEDDVPRES